MKRKLYYSNISLEYAGASRFLRKSPPLLVSMIIIFSHYIPVPDNRESIMCRKQPRDIRIQVPLQSNIC